MIFSYTFFLCFFVYVSGALGAPFDAFNFFFGKEPSNLELYPDEHISSEGYLCSKYRGQDLTKIPRECVYEIVCGVAPDPRYLPCFPEGKEPKGLISTKRLQKMAWVCRKQAICGYAAPKKTPEKASMEKNGQKGNSFVVDGNTGYMKDMMNKPMSSEITGDFEKDPTKEEMVEWEELVDEDFNLDEKPEAEEIDPLYVKLGFVDKSTETLPMNPPISDEEPVFLNQSSWNQNPLNGSGFVNESGSNPDSEDKSYSKMVVPEDFESEDSIYSNLEDLED